MINPTLAPTPGKRRWQRFWKGTAAGAVVGLAAAATNAGLIWLRYGTAHPAPDPLLDALMPTCEVAERHEIEVDAPADVTFAAARELDLDRSPIVRAIMGIRTLPTRVTGASGPVRHPAGLVDETLALGWRMVAEIPNRALVMGAVTRPWEPIVTFHGVTASEFRAYNPPTAAKIVWTLEVDSLGPSRSRARTQTRVVTTDEAARRLFRRYWAVFSPGIIVIRWESLRLIRADAERRARNP